MDKMSKREAKLVAQLEQNVINDYMHFSNAKPKSDGKLNIYPECSKGCHYGEVCPGTVCSLALEHQGRKNEIPDVCKDFNELMDARLGEYLSSEYEPDSNRWNDLLDSCPKCGAKSAWVIGADGMFSNTGSPYKIICTSCGYRTIPYDDLEACKADWNNN